MNIYKRTENMILTTNMQVTAKSIAEGEFKIEHVIEHLQKHKERITKNLDAYKDLYKVFGETLNEFVEESITFDKNSITITRPNLRAKTFFHPSCRIIRIDLTEGTRAIQGAVSTMSKSLLEFGYDMVPKSGCHSVLVIKIERMTDYSCFANWTIVR